MAHKTTALLLGLPVPGIIISAFTVFTVSHFFGYMFYLLIFSFSFLLIYSAHIKKNGDIFNLYSSLLLPIKIVVSGLPNGFIEKIDNIINDNKKVVAGLPKDKLLRVVLEQYIKEKNGSFEFVDSGDIVLANN